MSDWRAEVRGAFHGNQYTGGKGGGGAKAPAKAGATKTNPTTAESKKFMAHPAVKSAEKLYQGNPWHMASALQKHFPGITGAKISQHMDNVEKAAKTTTKKKK